MQRIFDKLIPTSGNGKLGKSMLFNDAGKFTFTVIPFLAKKKQEDELSHQKINDQIVMFDFFGALNY
jgi:hypothetical protein